MKLSTTKGARTLRVCVQAVSLVVIVLLFEIVFLMAQPSHFARYGVFSSWAGPKLNHTTKRSLLPPPLTPIALTRNYSFRNFDLAHKFSQPLLLHVYQRYAAGNESEIILFSTGVHMGTFLRNFSVAGCVIGDHVYPVNSYSEDRSTCTVPRGITNGTPITLALILDDTLRTAIRGPVTIAKNFVAELEDGDLRPLLKGTTLHGELAAYSPDELVTIRSNVVWKEQMDPFTTTDYPKIPRYEICMVTQIKPSTYMLHNWIEYHRRLGVDHVYIFDNGAEEDVAAMFSDRPDVEVMYWPWEKSQIQVFTYSVYAIRPRCEWLLLIDSDEYIMLGLDGPDNLADRELPPLKKYARMKYDDGFVQVKFHWVNMKNSGYIKRPPEPAPEVYIHREDPQVGPEKEKTLGKTMVHMDAEWVNSNAHARRAEGRAPVFQDGSMMMYPTRIVDTGMIVHYRARSWQEYQEKLRSGRANLNNPKTVKQLERWNRQANEEFRGLYMRESAINRKVYTHFRDIWRRVMKEVSIGKAVTVKYQGGARCRTVYDFSSKEFDKPLRETCVQEKMMS